jgi:glycosyltransferase involved in cell wall biosynthesis
VSVVYNGVDTTHFAPRQRPAAREGSRVRFAALGRLDPRKGLDLALAALVKVPRAELDIVGDGEARASLEQLVRRLGLGDRVRFSGFASDVRDAIARCDVALSSSRQEGLGIALLEAMAMGRPVVAVPVGGVPEIVRPGESGWLADVRSVDALARVMNAAIEDPDERLRRGIRAREDVVSRFSIAAMRGGYAQVYAALTD